MDQFQSWLSSDELERAARFHFERDRKRFILARGALRWILGRYLESDPASLKFAYGPAGKPMLAGSHAGQLHFNLSHSEGLAICAVSSAHEVGVDIERVREVPEACSILEQHFPAETMKHWRGLPEDQRAEGFLRAWVRREACLKWSGHGLAGLSEDSPRLEHTRLTDFTPAPDYVGALAW